MSYSTIRPHPTGAPANIKLHHLPSFARVSPGPVAVTCHTYSHPLGPWDKICLLFVAANGATLLLLLLLKKDPLLCHLLDLFWELHISCTNLLSTVFKDMRLTPHFQPLFRGLHLEHQRISKANLSLKLSACSLEGPRGSFLRSSSLTLETCSLLSDFWIYS